MGRWQGLVGRSEHRGASGDEVIREKLVHIHLVQWAYLHTWTRQPWEPPKLREVSNLAAVWRWAYPYYAEVKRFLNTADQEAVAEPLPESFANRIEQDLGVRRATPTIAESAIQVASHSTHHRGQLNTRLRALGAEPPRFDYIAWVWFGRPTADWKEPG